MTTEAKQTIETGWTKEFPRVDGMYWWRADPTDNDPDIHEVQGEFFYQVGFSSSEVVNNYGGEWLGPISPADCQQLAALKEALKRIRDCTQDMWACSFAGAVVKGSSLEDALRHAEKYDEDGGITRLAALREAHRETAAALKEAAFALHVEVNHKPAAFSECGDVICAQARRTWNSAAALREALSKGE